MENSLYQVLGLSPVATTQEIKEAYRLLVRLHHPDANPDTREDSEATMKDVLVAYATLSDPQKRAQYDVECKLSAFEAGQNRGLSEVQVVHHPTSYGETAAAATSLMGRVRTALSLSPPQMATKIGVSERDLGDYELRDAIPQTPIQLRTFTYLVEQAVQNLEANGNSGEAIDLRTAFGRKKSNRNFFR